MLSNDDCSWGCDKFFPEAEQAPEVRHHQAAKASNSPHCVHAFYTQTKKFFFSNTIMAFKCWLQKQRQKHSPSSSVNETVAVNSDDARQGQGRSDVTKAVGSRNTNDSRDDQAGRNETNKRSNASEVDYAPSTLDNIPIHELWNVAYERLREENGPLIAEYESSLKGVVAAGVAQTLGFGTNIREQMWTILQKRMEEVNNNTKLKLGNHEVQMKDISQLISNVINSANNYISQAVSGNPFASIAWTGISFLLPVSGDIL